MRKGILIALLLFATISASRAWGQAPVISSFSTDVPGDNLYAPGTTVFISGTFTPESAGRDYTITIGGQTAGINFAANALLIVANVPANAAPGADSLVITYQGLPSNALPITIAAVAPEFQNVALTINGQTTPPVVSYNPFLHANMTGQPPVTAASPAGLGEVIQAEVSGLGSDVAPAVTPTVTVSGQNAQVVQINNSVNDPQSETIFFSVPSTAPLGNDPVVVTVATVASVPQILPVGNVPQVFTNGTVNAASLIPGNPPPALAPSSIATVFGANLTNGSSCVPPCSQTLNANGILNASLSGATLTINGTPAPIFFATPGQLGFEVPTELTPSGSATIAVTVGGQTTSPGNFNLTEFSPGIFTTNSSGSGQGAVLNGTEIGEGISSLVAPVNSFPNSHPAQPGSVVVIYCTGLGPVSPPIATGALPASGQTTVTQPTVTIGGLPATVQFSGLTPGDAGLYQINVVVPPAAPAGNSVPLVVNIAGATSNTVTIALQ